MEALIILPNLKTLDDEPYESDEREEAAEVRALRLVYARLTPDGPLIFPYPSFQQIRRQREEAASAE